MVTSRKNVLIERHDNVAKVIINDPEKRNRLTQEIIADLISAYEELRKDDSVVVVITTGAGDTAWSAGQAGQVLLAGLENRRQGGPNTNRMKELDELVRNYPKVTIAAVNGYCLGAAITLLVVHDLAIASEERARFGLPEIFRGFPPRTILASLFRAVPLKYAFDMVITGDNWDARTAQRTGLITRVVPHAKLQESALQWAKEIARWDPITQQYSKKAAHAAMDEPSFVKALQIVADVCDEHDHVNAKSHEGMKKFLGGTGVKATELAKWM